MEIDREVLRERHESLVRRWRDLERAVAVGGMTVERRYAGPVLRPEARELRHVEQQLAQLERLLGEEK
jgi:hypothetical protein